MHRGSSPVLCAFSPHASTVPTVAYTRIWVAQIKAAGVLMQLYGLATAPPPPPLLLAAAAAALLFGLVLASISAAASPHHHYFAHPYRHASTSTSTAAS